MKEKCKSCWWQEGGLCYIDPCKRDDKGISNKKADKICKLYVNKRKKLSTVIPNDMLVITSENK